MLGQGKLGDKKRDGVIRKLYKYFDVNMFFCIIIYPDPDTQCMVCLSTLGAKCR